MTIFKLLNILNQEIEQWAKCFGKFFSYFLALSLDVYLYKLLWKFVKRLHPRRNNTWIYTKYWRIFSGLCKFFCFDTLTNRLCFLKSHLIMDKNTNSLPLLLDTPCFLNYRKLFSVSFKKSNSSFSGIYKYLLVKQRGICCICCKPLEFSSFKFLLQYRNSVKICSLSLIHTYCLN